jgi:hypothetical protein
MSRPCRNCGAAIGRTIETCPQCGAFNRAERTIWVWLAGGFVVLILFLALGDLGVVLRVAGDLLARIHSALAPAS